MAAAYSAVHWGHALVSSVLLWQERWREREGKKEAEGRREIEKLPLCHRAPTSARVTHLPADILPPCPGAAGKPRSASEWGHWVQREPVGEDS